MVGISSLLEARAARRYGRLRTEEDLDESAR